MRKITITAVVMTLLLVLATPAQAATAPSYVVDNYDDGDLSEYAEFFGDNDGIDVARTYTDASGDVELKFEGTENELEFIGSRSGLATYPRPGNSFVFQEISWDGTDPGVIGFRFGVGTSDFSGVNWEVAIDPKDNSITLKQHNGAGTVDSVSTNIEDANGSTGTRYYNISVHWKNETFVEATIFDDDGNQVAKLSGSGQKDSDKGIAIGYEASATNNDIYFDRIYINQISGTVKDTDGNTVSGASITVYNGTGKNQVVATNSTNSNGKYTIRNITDGSKVVEASSAWHLNQSKTVTVNGGTTVDFSLPRLYRINGTVTDRRGDPIPNATVEATNLVGGFASNTTDSNGRYSLKLRAGRDWSLSAEKNGYIDTSLLFSSLSQNRTHDFMLNVSEPPYVEFAAFTGGAYRKQRTLDIRAYIKDPNQDRVTATLFWHNGSGYEAVARIRNGSSGTWVTATVDSRPGTNKWYVEMTDGLDNRTSNVFTYETPGYIEVRNASDLSKIQSANVTITSRDSNYYDERTVSNGLLDLEGVPDERLYVRISASGYDTLSLAVNDPAKNYTALLSPTASSTSTRTLQGFELVDQDGDYPVSDSFLVIERYYLGGWRGVTSGYFTPDNNVTATLKHGEVYRFTVCNGQGNCVTLGEKIYQPSNFQQPEPLIVQEQDDQDGNTTNKAPVARFNYSPTAPTTSDGIFFDATSSNDTDGTIAYYYWDFDGDGSIDERGSQTSYSYRSGGTYDVTLTVEDGDGANDTVTQSIYVNNSNNPPVARIDVNRSSPYVGQSITFNGSNSSDEDGAIQNYWWDVNGSGVDYTGTTVSHTYSSAGNYNVSLTVSDGQTNSSTTVSLFVAANASAANERPTANYTYSPSNPDAGQTVSFNGSGSSDPDGTIESYEWDLDNDGVFEKNGSQIGFPFQTNGTYYVTLRVTDNQSSQDSQAKLITVGSGEPTAPPNEPPTVSVNVTPSNPDPGVQVNLSANASDPDGNVSAIEWDIGGDGTIDDRGNYTLYTWQQEGTYQVEVTVVDDVGTSTTETVLVTVGDGDPTDGPTVSFDASLSDANESDQRQTIEVDWSAKQGADVSNLTIRIHEYGNKSNVIFAKGYGTGQSVSIAQPITGGQLNKSWVVVWSATVDGEQRSGRERLKPGSGGIDPPFASAWLSPMILVTLTIVAGLYPEDLATFGALILVGFAGVVMLFQWVDLPVYSWWIAATIAILGHVRTAQGVR